MIDDKIVSISFHEDDWHNPGDGTPPTKKRSTYTRESAKAMFAVDVKHENINGQYTIVATFPTEQDATAFRLKCM